MAAGRQAMVECGNQPAARVVQHADTAVLQGALTEPVRRTVIAVVVDGNQFPVNMILRLNAVQTVGQGIQGIVERQQNTDKIRHEPGI